MAGWLLGGHLLATVAQGIPIDCCLGSCMNSKHVND